MTTLVQVRGTIRAPDNTPAPDLVVTFRLSDPLLDSASNLLVQPVTVRADVSPLGVFAVSLIANDDPALQPAGSTYLVSVSARGTSESRSIIVPIAGAALGVELADIATSVSVPGPVSFVYALSSALTAETDARVAADAVRQPLDSDLTAIAAVDSALAGVLASEGAGWLRRTYGQVKTSLGIVKADVGLGLVDNTADADKPVSTAQQAANVSDRARVNHTGTQAAATVTGLAAVATSGLKADVGLGNADNTADASKPVSTAQAAADALRVPLSLIDAAGDLIVGAADNTAARLAPGLALTGLRVTAAGTSLEWAALDYPTTFVEGTATAAGDSQAVGATTFTKLRLTLASGTAANFDDATDEYIAPEVGLYLVTASLRLIDSTAASTGHGIGVHTSAIDGPHFRWFTHSPDAGVSSRRSTAGYTRLLRLSAGQRLQLFTFINIAATVTDRSMTIVKVTP